MTDETTQIKARLYRLEQALKKETLARKAIQVGMDQDEFVAFVARVDEKKQETLATIICKAVVSEVFFLAKNSKDIGLQLKAQDWVYMNIDAPDKEWLKREKLTTGEWMVLVEEGTPLFEFSGKTENGRPSNYES